MLLSISLPSLSACAKIRRFWTAPHNGTAQPISNRRRKRVKKNQRKNHVHSFVRTTVGGSVCMPVHHNSYQNVSAFVSIHAIQFSGVIITVAPLPPSQRTERTKSDRRTVNELKHKKKTHTPNVHRHNRMNAERVVRDASQLVCSRVFCDERACRLRSYGAGKHTSGALTLSRRLESRKI